MSEKKKRIFCMIATIIMLIGLMPPLPTRSAAIAIPAARGAQALLDWLQIAGGVQIGVSDPFAAPSYPCVCVGVQMCTGTRPRHTDTINTMNRIFDQPAEWDASLALLFDAVQEAERIVDGIWDPVAAAEKIIRNSNLPDPWGPRDLPFFPFMTQMQDLEQLLWEYGDITEATAENGGFFFDFYHQEFRWFEQPPAPPEIPSFVQGFVHNGTIPVITPTNDFPWNSSMSFNAQQVSAIIMETRTISSLGPSSINLNGNTYSISRINQAQRGTYLYRNGASLRRLRTITAPGGWYSTEGISRAEQMGISSRFFVFSNSPTIIRSLHVSQCLDENAPRFPNSWSVNAPDTGLRLPAQTISPPTTVPGPQAPPASAQQPNILQNPAQVMQEIREIVTHPDNPENEVIIMLPLLQPEFFPDIAPEHFPQFVQDVLDNLRREHVIVPGHEVREITINMPNMPRLPRPSQVRPPSTDYSQDLWNIQRQLDQQTRHLQNIEREAADISRQLRNPGNFGELDWTPIEELRALNGVFPFSIPWDLRNAIEAMFGGSVEQAPAPVFTIDLTETALNYSWELDLSEFEILAAVVRWGLMALFVVGLIIGTSKLIQW